MNTAFKTTARNEWHRRVQNSLTVPPPPSEAMERWILLQQSLAKYSPTFHGGLMTGYNHGPAAFEAVIGALENAFQAASGPSTRTPTFLGLQQ
jgi:hypothetical protein